MNYRKTQDLAHICLMTAAMAICSWITIPYVVPFTLQTFGVFVSLELLGGKNGTKAILIYILLGAIGVPVFSGFQGGIGKLLGSTGGYIFGFLLTAVIYWFCTEKIGNNKTMRTAALIIGLIALYVTGSLWFMHVYSSTTGPVTLGTVLSWCVFPFIGPDLIKLFAAIIVSESVRKAVTA